MKKNIQTSVMMMVLLTLLIVSSMMYAIPVSMAIEPTDPSYDPRGTWTLTLPDYQSESSITYLMIIDTYNEATGDFSGFGRQTDGPIVRLEVSGTLSFSTNDVTVAITVDDLDNGYILLNRPGNVFPEIETDPMMMTDSMNVEYPQWYAIKRTAELVRNPIQDRIQVTFPEGSSIDVVSASPTTEIPPPPKAVGEVYDIHVEASPGPGIITLCIRVDIDDVQGNPKKLYMVKYTSPQGDVDNNGMVTFLDLIIIGRLVGTVFGEPNFDPSCDLNKDGEITIADCIICISHMGETGEWVQIDSIVRVVDANNDGSIDFVVVCAFPDHFSGWGIRR